jgi:uncharacterized protein DUF6812
MSERSLAGRLPTERIRTLQEVTLTMIDGTEVRGMLHRAHGSRTLDFLNRQSEGFVALTGVTLYRGEETEMVPFLAVNKLHILRLIEADEDA